MQSLPVPFVHVEQETSHSTNLSTNCFTFAWLSHSGSRGSIISIISSFAIALPYIKWCSFLAIGAQPSILTCQTQTRTIHFCICTWETTNIRKCAIIKTFLTSYHLITTETNSLRSISWCSAIFLRYCEKFQGTQWLSKIPNIESSNYPIKASPNSGFPPFIWAIISLTRFIYSADCLTSTRRVCWFYIDTDVCGVWTHLSKASSYKYPISKITRIAKNHNNKKFTSKHWPTSQWSHLYRHCSWDQFDWNTFAYIGF